MSQQNNSAATSTEGFPLTSVYDASSGTAVQIAAGTVSTDANHNSTKSAPMQVQLATGSLVVGDVVIQAVSGTALAADATNSELRVSLYVKTTAAGDTVLTMGQAAKANSLPVTIASDQSLTVGLVAGSALAGGVNIVDSAGTNKAGVDANHILLVSDGGTATVQITASSAGAVKASPGRLCRILVGTTATAAVNIYDNTNAASGTIIGAVPAGAAIGTVYAPNMPASVGIYVGGGAGTPQLTCSFA